MIGIIVIGVIVGYILLSKFIVTKVLQSYGLKKANIALAIMILIPTWDVILGFPVYAYLCMTQSGTKIYKTVDNVEGFYVGEKSIGSEPIEPYEDYRYVDYQEVKNNKPTGKYYRSYWVDYFKNQEMANICVYPPYPNSSRPYTQAFKSGKCIVKEEIADSEVSRWDLSWELKTKQIARYHPINIYVLGLSINKVGQIRDNNTNEILSEQFSIDWNMGWIASIFTSIETGHPKIKICGIDYSNVIELEHKTLKPKKQEEK